MSKIVFPGAGAPYRGFVGEVRGWLQRIGSFAEKAPGSIPTLIAQVNAFTFAALGKAYTIAFGAAIGLRNSAGSVYAPTMSVTLSGTTDVLPHFRMPSTSFPFQSGTKITIPAPTGTYVNGITFTIVAGISAK